VTADWAPPAPDANDARLSLQSGPIAAAVLGRVLGMLAARADCPIDRLDDALLITDAIAAHAPAHSTDGRVTVTITARRGELVLVVSELRPGGGQELIGDSAVPGVGSVLERVADEVSHRQTTAGGEELVLALGFEPGERDNGDGERSDAT
jgi:serine/threonine-protein kinase RsbW